MKRLSLFCFFLTICFTSFGQQDTIINPLSIEKIPYYEQLYRFRVERIIDLAERQNSGFSSRQSAIARFLIESIQNGKINVYNDSLANGKVQSINQTLVSNTAVMSELWDKKKSYLANEGVSVNGVNYTSLKNDNLGHSPSDASWWEKSIDQTTYISSDDVAGLKLVEDVIFDKRRSRMFYDIQAIGIMVQKAGSDQMNPQGYILYRDFAKLVDTYAHSKVLTERDMVLWRNRYNPAENRAFTDAFKLRLFHGVIEKVENPDDLTIEAIFRNNKRSFSESIYARWEEEMKMMEKEHNLWEY